MEEGGKTEQGWNLDFQDRRDVPMTARRMMGMENAGGSSRAKAVKDVLGRGTTPPGFLADRAETEAVAALKQVLQKGSVVSENNRRTSRDRDLEEFQKFVADGWVLAREPAGMVFQTLFMMWMAGTHVNVFSVMSTVSSGFMVLGRMRDFRKTFRPLESRHPGKAAFLWPAKLMYLLLCLAGLVAVQWNCRRLGFLPTSESDWAGYLEPLAKPSIIALA
uniref:ER membrane protein complex subunit 4 n=1 Tax=Compsopogon caeruleus TaxID=31354 RepID=A0A7S1XH36_9RHOD|mmetsp:Transcript_7775/g.15694  ORF Transcript_7775/g.15694 Transcript_7775/m.15694 type:complete len:219 (+) Transcript_7775:85-741(+)